MVYGLMILKLWLKIKWDFDFRFVGPLRGLSNNPFLETRRNSFFGFLVSYEIRNFSWTRNLGCEFEEAMTVKQPKNRVMKKKITWLAQLFSRGKCYLKKPQTWTHEKHADEDVGVLQKRVSWELVVVYHYRHKRSPYDQCCLLLICLNPEINLWLLCSEGSLYFHK